jgi:hypothetical protein
VSDAFERMVADLVGIRFCGRGRGIHAHQGQRLEMPGSDVPLWMSILWTYP